MATGIRLSDRDLLSLDQQTDPPDSSSVADLDPDLVAALDDEFGAPSAAAAGPSFDQIVSALDAEFGPPAAADSPVASRSGSSLAAVPRPMQPTVAPGQATPPDATPFSIPLSATAPPLTAEQRGGQLSTTKTPDIPSRSIGEMLIDVPLNTYTRAAKAALASFKRGAATLGTTTVGAAMMVPEAAVTSIAPALLPRASRRQAQTQAAMRQQGITDSDSEGVLLEGQTPPVAVEPPDALIRGAELIRAGQETAATNYPANPAQVGRGDALRFLDPEWWGTVGPESSVQTGAALAATVAAGPASPVVASALYGLSEMGSNYTDLELQFLELGYPIEQARQMASQAALASGGANAVIGGILPMEAMLGRLAAPAAARTAAGRVAGHLAAGTAAEGLTEAAETVTPSVAGQFLDPRVKMPSGKEVLDAAAIGAVMGGTAAAGSAATAELGRRAELPLVAGAQQQEEATPAPTVAESLEPQPQAKLSPISRDAGERAITKLRERMDSEIARHRSLGQQLWGDQYSEYLGLLNRAEVGDKEAQAQLGRFELTDDAQRQTLLAELHGARQRAMDRLTEIQRVYERMPADMTSPPPAPQKTASPVESNESTGRLERTVEETIDFRRRPYTPEQTARMQESVTWLNEQIQTERQTQGLDGDGPRFELEQRPAVLAKRSLRFAELISRQVFGRELVPVRSTAANAPNGVFSARRPDTIFVQATGGTNPVLRVLAHEAGHAIASELRGDGALHGYYHTLERALDLPAWREKYRQGRARASAQNDAYVDEEALSEQLAANISRADFWRQVRDADPTLFNRLAYRIISLIERIEGALAPETAGRELEGMMNESGLRETRRMLARMVAETSRRTRARQRSADVATQPQAVDEVASERNAGRVGSEWPFFVGNNSTPHRTRWRLVPISSVVASNDPLTFNPRQEFPQDVQPRNYEGQKGEQEKVAAGAAALNPWKVISDNTTAESGAPVVVRDARGRWIVLSGNGRSQMIQRAQALHPERATAYQRHLADQAERFGLAGEAVHQSAQPMMLVRELLDVPRDQWEQIGRDANVSQAREYDETEAAIDLSRKIDDQVLLAGLNLEGDDTIASVVNDPTRRERFIAAMVRAGAITNQNEGRYAERTADGGRQLTSAGRTLIEQALLAKAFEGNDQRAAIDLLASWPALERSISASVPHLVKVRSYLARGLDPAYNLPAMLYRLADAMRRTGATSWDALRQVNDFVQPVTPFERGVGQVLADVLLKPAQLRERVKSFAELSEAALRNQGGMMPLTPGEVLLGWADELGISLADRAAIESQAAQPLAAQEAPDADGFKFQEQKGGEANATPQEGQGEGQARLLNEQTTGADLFTERQAELYRAPQSVPTGQGDLFSRQAFGAAQPSVDERVGRRARGSDLSGQMDLFGADVPGAVREPKGPPSTKRPPAPTQPDLFKFQEAATAGVMQPDEDRQARKAWQEMGVESPWFKRWFGDWQGLSAAQQYRTTEPVRITGHEIVESWEDFKTQRRRMNLRVRQWAKKNLPETKELKAFGWNVKFTPIKIKNALYHGAGPHKMQAVAALPELLDRAVLIGSSRIDRGELPSNYVISHILAAPLDISGARFDVGLVVHQDSNGESFYDHELTEVKTAGGVPSESGASSFEGRLPVTDQRPSVMSIVRKALEVKPAKVSKTVDAQGRPLVVYHRTAADFSQFDPSRAKGGDVAGLYFSAAADTPTAPPSETDRVLPVYLRLMNPATSEDKWRIVRQLGRDWTPEQMASAMQREGFDGLIDTDYRAVEYVAFRPEQIKSAIGNRGTFDPENPDIRFMEQKNSEVVNAAPLPNWRERIMSKMVARGGLPVVVFEENLKRIARISEEQRRLRDLHRDLKRGIGKVWKRESLVPAPAVHMMNAALQGSIAINELPEPVRLPLLAMRNYIDTLSREMVDRGLVNEGLEAVIERNLRFYLHRSYRIGDEGKKWIRRIPAPVFNHAVDYTHRALVRARAFRMLYPADAPQDKPVDWFDHNISQVLARASAEVTREDAERHLLNFLNDRAERPRETLNTLKIGQKDLSIFMRKTDLAEAIRRVLGEYDTPLINSAKTITKMGSFIANEEFLRSVREAGMGVFLFEPDQAKEGYNVQLAGEASQVMSPLNGLRTSEAIAEAFDALDRKMTENMALIWWMKFNSAAKVSKTVGSIMTQVVNLAGQPIFNLMNGHLNPRSYAQAIKTVLTDWGGMKDAQQRERLYRYVNLGLVGNSVVAEELRATLNDAGLRDWGAKSETFPPFVRRFIELAGRGLDAAMAVYESSDSLGKVVGFENELARMKRLRPELPLADQEAAAARRILNTYPTYSMLPQWANWFRRFPVLAPFVAFSYESVRTVGWSIRYAFEDMRSGTAAGRREGALRLAGTLAAVGLVLPTIQYASMLAAGISPDDDEDFRRFQPDWAKTGYFLYLGKQNGKIRAIHLSRYSPYSYLSEPFGELIRGAASGDWERWRQAIGRAVQDTLEPWISNQLGTAAAVELWTNRTETGQRIRNPEESFLRQALDVARYGWEKTLEPGTVTRLRRRVLPALRGEVTSYGAMLDPKMEAVAELTGARVMSLDVRQALAFATRNMGREGRDASIIFNETVTKQGAISPSAIVDAYVEANDVRFEQWREMYGNVQAARRQGLADDEISAAIDQSGFSERNTAALMAGQFVPIELWGKSGRPSPVLRRAEAIPGRALPVEQLAALEEERQGWVLD